MGEPGNVPPEPKRSQSPWWHWAVVLGLLTAPLARVANAWLRWRLPSALDHGLTCLTLASVPGLGVWFFWISPWLLAGDAGLRWRVPPRQMARNLNWAVWVLPAILIPLPLFFVFYPWIEDLGQGAPVGWRPEQTAALGLTLVFSLALIPARFLHRSIRRRLWYQTMRRRVCWECGYDLRGSPGPACPECGWIIPPPEDAPGNATADGGRGPPPPAKPS